MRIFNYIFIGIFMLIRPLLGPARCKYPISCGIFAVQELKEKNLFKALWNIAKRIISCV